MEKETKKPAITQLLIGYSINVAQFEQLKVEATATVGAEDDPDKVAAETNRYLKAVAYRLKCERLEELKRDNIMNKLERLNFMVKDANPNATEVNMASPAGFLQKIVDRILDLSQKPVVLEEMFKTLHFDYNSLKAICFAMMQRDVDQWRHHHQDGDYDLENFYKVEALNEANRK